MKIVARNKKAFFNYEILETYEAGIVLSGDEVKSVRAGKISLNEAFATMREGELFLINCHIAPYLHAYSKAETSRRSRKLLLHKGEINKLIGAISRKGLTIVPLKMYITGRGLIKIELGVARHKKAPSKKREQRERDIKRQTDREMKVKIT